MWVFFFYNTKVSILSQLDKELKENLKGTMQQKYRQPGEESITQAVDKLQQEVCKNQAD